MSITRACKGRDEDYERGACKGISLGHGLSQGYGDYILGMGLNAAISHLRCGDSSTIQSRQHVHAAVDVLVNLGYASFGHSLWRSFMRNHDLLHY